MNKYYKFQSANRFVSKIPVLVYMMILSLNSVS